MIWTEKNLTCPKCDRVAKMQLLIKDGRPVQYCPFCGRSHESHGWYKKVSSQEAKCIIQARKPLGLFVSEENGVFVGIDNSGGDAWTEEFQNELDCLKWLLQEGEEDPRCLVQKKVFDVYYLDVYQEDGSWVENERHRLGRLEVTPTHAGEIGEDDVLTAMAKFTYPDWDGRRLKALNTTDRRRVYVEDYYGSGEWWEVGTVKGRMPVYGLKLIEDAA